MSESIFSSDYQEKITLKSHVEFFWKHKKLYIFSQPGKAIILKDENKFIYSTCELLNDGATPKVLAQCLSASYKNELEFLDKLLTVLDKEFLLEHDVKSSASSEHLETNLKNINFLSSYLPINIDKYSLHNELTNKKIAILGLGGVGSNILIALASFGYKNFVVTDYDTIDLSNLNRQFLYQKSDAGELKTIAAVKNIKKHFPNLNIDVNHCKINSEQSAVTAINDTSFVFSCIDEPRELVLEWVNAACFKLAIPYMSGGLDSRWASFFTIIPNKSGCLRCWKNQVDKNKVMYSTIHNNPTHVAPKEPNLAIMPMTQILSGMMVNDYIKFSTEISKMQSEGRLIVYDFETGLINIKEEWQRSHSCIFCCN